MKKKELRLPLKYEKDSGLIVGYANRAILDDDREYIPAEAWFKALQRFFHEGMPVKLLHRPNLIVGETVWLKIVEDGLVLASRPKYPEIQGLIARGLIKAYSIGFILNDALLQPDGTIEINDLELVEISYVDEPANKGCFFLEIRMKLENKEIMFDAEKGVVTVAGLTPEEMALLSAALGDLLVKAGVPTGTVPQAVMFKCASSESIDSVEDGEKSRRATRIQTLIFDKSVFSSAEEAIKWAEENNFRADKVDETKESFRLRQFSPDCCQDDTFRTIELTRGVKAVICRPKGTCQLAAESGEKTEEKSSPVAEGNHKDTNSSTDAAANEGKRPLGEVVKVLRQLLALFGKKTKEADVAAQEKSASTATTPAVNDILAQVDEKYSKQLTTMTADVDNIKKEVATIKESLQIITEILQAIVPPQKSTPINNPGGEKKTTKWGLFPQR